MLRMRFVRLAAPVCILFFSQPLFAQGWIEYQNPQDHFSINAPGEPKTEAIKWKSEYDSMFPGNVYRWQEGANRYSVTVIDYSDSEAIFRANHHSDDFQDDAYWQIDILGSMAYAATQYRMKPGVKVTFDAFHYINLITGHQLQLTNPDATRTYVALYLHENRLYILDATVTKVSPPPIIFQQSFAVLDAEGKNLRYRTYYFNKVPDTKLGRRRAGADAAAQPQGAGGGGAQGQRGGGQPQNQPR
jgi:hypothetical protein